MTNTKTVITPQGDVLVYDAASFVVTEYPPFPPLADEERQEIEDAGIVTNISFTDEPVKASAIVHPYQPLTNSESSKLLSSESQEIRK